MITLDLFHLSILICTFLALFFLIGMSLFSAGLVRSRNTIDVLAKNLTSLAIVFMLFVLFSEQLIMTENRLLTYFPKPAFAYIDIFISQQKLSYLFFQMICAAIPLSIIIALTAERLKFWSFIFFSIFMLLLIYPVVVFWVWGHGFLNTLGFKDIGGASVMHLTGAVAGFAALLFLGRRKGRFDKPAQDLLSGANIPLAFLGYFFMLIGGMAINVGGELFHHPAFNMTGVTIILFNTCVASAAGLLVCLILSRILYGVVEVTIMMNGAIAGLVAISAAPLSTNMNFTALIGAVAGLICILMILFFNKIKFDDSMGICASHGGGAIWGLSAVALTEAWQDLYIQLWGIFTIISWTFLVSLGFWTLIRFTMGLRIKPKDEFKGLDILGCGINAYPEFTRAGVER